MKIRNLLITGGCGFIGTNFIHFLFEKTSFKGGVINLDKLTYSGNPDNLSVIVEKYGDRYFFRQGDICDKPLLKKIFSQYGVDAVCHFAAESHVDRSIKNPTPFIYSNIFGTYNLLEVCREYADDFLLFHHISTDEVFGSLGHEGFFTETTPYQPNSPYAASKASSDHLVRAYFRTYGLPVIISNCSNNYGPYQFPEKLIPLMILNAVEGKPLPVYGDGKHIRDWLYVEDHCRAIWTIMNYGKRGETYNIGGGSEMENIRIIEMICEFVDEVKDCLKEGPRKGLITFIKDRPGHDRRYAMDYSKLANELHWEPKETLASGLRKTIQWYLDNEKWIERVKSGDYRNWIASHYGTQ